MERKIDKPQSCDMGHGYGQYLFEEKDTLKDFLEWYRTHMQTWGTITIFDGDKILRKFDHNIYNKGYHNFYYRLNAWENESLIKRITFKYCFMNEDVVIYLK